jgi:hypothetical protein
LDDRVSFPWFSIDSTPEEVKAYTYFVAALGKMAKELRRVTAKPRAAESEKYTMRCFLLRLGFIGPSFKDERKRLLKNLSGSSAFKNSVSGGDGDE